MHDQLSTDVYLKFWSPYRLAVIKIDHVLAPQQELYLGNNDDEEVVSPVYVNYDFKWYSTVLAIHWQDNRLVHRPNQYRILLPNQAPIPQSVRPTLTKIIDSRTFQLSLILRTDFVMEFSLLGSKTGSLNLSIIISMESNTAKEVGGTLMATLILLNTL